MRAVLVMPCLNEELLLERTCASLGFGVGLESPERDIHLVLVDNGSDDRTPQVMRKIKANSPRDRVHIVTERLRGYVPARHAGALAAREVAKAGGVDDVVVLQVDADTHYTPGYAQYMLDAASHNPGRIIEGTSVVGGDFSRLHPGYQERARRIDDAVLAEMPDDDDLLVGDAVCAFRLSDYFKWGEHQRDYLSSGEEILAETTRLLLRARGKGAQILRERRAVALPSRRKVTLDPVAYFASAGFPREASWLQRWRLPPYSETGFDAFGLDADDPVVRIAEAARQAHLIAFFVVLPRLVKMHGADPAEGMLARLGVPVAHPPSDIAELFQIVFNVADNCPAQLLGTVTAQPPRARQ
jgi:hypothetical protein